MERVASSSSQHWLPPADLPRFCLVVYRGSPSGSKAGPFQLTRYHLIGMFVVWLPYGTVNHYLDNRGALLLRNSFYIRVGKTGAAHEPHILRGFRSPEFIKSSGSGQRRHWYRKGCTHSKSTVMVSDWISCNWYIARWKFPILETRPAVYLLTYKFNKEFPILYHISILLICHLYVNCGFSPPDNSLLA